MLCIILGACAECTITSWVSVYAEKYNIDENKIVLTGDSSGAFICSYVAALKFDDALREAVECEEVKININGLMLMCGIYDLEVLLKGSSLMGVIPQTARMVFDFDLDS